MTKGIFLIAGGHVEYKRMACNLAMAIKTTSPGVKIAVCTEDEMPNPIISETYRKFFDHLVPMPPSDHKSFIRLKTTMIDLTPFDRTIAIDVDTLVFPTKDVSTLFDRFSDKELMFGIRSAKPLKDFDKLQWITKQNLQKYVMIDPSRTWTSITSEFMYIDKTGALAQKVFGDAQSAFDTLKRADVISFSGGVPDELAFEISLYNNKVEFDTQDWLPFWWAQVGKRLSQEQLLRSEFYGMSIGGHKIDNHPAAIYNSLVKWYCQKNGIRHPFPCVGKRSFNPLRSKL